MKESVTNGARIKFASSARQHLRIGSSQQPEIDCFRVTDADFQSLDLIAAARKARHGRKRASGRERGRMRLDAVFEPEIGPTHNRAAIFPEISSPVTKSISGARAADRCPVARRSVTYSAAGAISRTA